MTQEEMQILINGMPAALTHEDLINLIARIVFMYTDCPEDSINLMALATACICENHDRHTASKETLH
jgi:hypothetical protein